jgi:hypothetical protein
MKAILFIGLLVPALALAAKVPGHDPDPLNIPLFTQPGHSRLSAHLGQKFEGIHASGSVALTPRWGLMGSAAYADLDRCPSCIISVRRHTDAAVGYYEHDSAKATTREAFAGVGLGRFRMSGNTGKWDPQPQDIRVTEGWYEQFYLQANLGKRFKWDDRGGSLRLALYRFTGFLLRDGFGDVLPSEPDHWGLYLEPGFVYRLGFRPVKLDLQLGASLPLLQADAVDNNLVWLSAGIGVDLFGK